ncbi:SprB repeat-containing protein, partial [Rhodocytophaga aerolata]|uniref:SprB repeat-containing protein n=1 Tax=Rhodocytophaga aerolata TaxID=455078 RepID=UPI003616B0F1
QSSGSAVVSATGGVPPYRYQWSNGATSPALEKLPAGSYTVTVTDGAGSSKTASLSLSQPAALTLQQTLSPETSSGRDGAISLAVAGGTGSYSYLWSTGATTKDLTGLAAGNYQLTLTDANGCQLSKTFTLARTPAAPLRLSLTARPPACQGASNGNIQASVSGGVAPYSYLWSSGATTQDLSGIAAGRYSLTVTDAQGTQTAAELTLQQPQLLLIQEQLLAESPAGGDGSISLSVSGGTAPYSYLWSSGATTQDLSALSAGSYQVRVTDAQGCYQERTFVLEQAPAAALLLSYRFTQPRCFGSASGSIRLSVSGGVPPYRYQWSNGATTSELTGIAAGSYQVSITDAKGSKQTQTILLPEATPLQISYSATAQSLPQEDGSIRLSVSGGTGPYSYLWSNGATSQNLSGLIAGTYGVSVTDAYGCQVHETIQVKQTSGQTATTPLTLTLSSQPLRCYGQPEGAVAVTVTGGVAPYRYQWSNGVT